MNDIERQDPEVWAAIAGEVEGPRNGLEMIASENYTLGWLVVVPNPLAIIVFMMSESPGDVEVSDSPRFGPGLWISRCHLFFGASCCCPVS